MKLLFRPANKLIDNSYMRWTNLFVGLLALNFTLGASAGTLGGSERTLQLLNHIRELSQVSPLIESSALDQAAAAKLADMQTAGYFAHTSPDGSNPWDFISRAGYDYQFAGENLAVSYPDADSQHQAWMQSPTHCTNMLDSRYTEVGLATGETLYKGRMVPMTVMLLASQTKIEQKIDEQKQMAAVCPATAPAPVVLGAQSTDDPTADMYRGLYRGAGAALVALVSGVLIARVVYYRSLHQIHHRMQTSVLLASPGLAHDHGSIHIHPRLVEE